MYLWKYWRESRIAFLISLLLIGISLMFTLHGTVWVGGPGTTSDLRHPGVEDATRQVTALLFVFFYLQIAPLGFFAWLVGSFGVGRNCGAATAGSGDLRRARGPAPSAS